jgi:cold-inducible RNA-binding protein
MAHKLFIGGLSFTTTEDRLRAAFAEVGTVESAAIVLDRDTGRSRGFGFVEMSTAEEAEQAIARFNGKDFDGRQIKVEKASSSQPRSQSASRGGYRTSRW